MLELPRRDVHPTVGLVLRPNVEDIRDPPPAAEVYPLKLASFVRLSAEGKKMADAGHFGLLPQFAKELSYGRKTYNARSETVSQLPSFKTAWKRGQRSIIPTEKIYEPCYESGKAVRWAIEDINATPLGVAGIWTQHPSMTMPDGSALLSFAMLTVNAQGPPSSSACMPQKMKNGWS